MAASCFAALPGRSAAGNVASVKDWLFSMALVALFAGFFFFRDKLEEKGEENPAYGTCCLLPIILGAFVLLLWLRFFS